MQLGCLKRPQKFIIVGISIVIVCTVVLHTDLAAEFYYVYWKPLEDVSCHYLESEDFLPSADEIQFPAKSIFFHETTCKGGLDARQACAVESAARLHPSWQINVLFTAPATEESLKNCSIFVEQFKNVNFYRIHVAKYARGTPLENFIRGGALNKSRWRMIHTSDILRYLTLYKWGGVYLDLDVVVAKPLDSLAANWAGRESEWAVAAGALAFSMDSTGREIADAAIIDIKYNYRGDAWGHNGPGVITRVLKDRCSTGETEQMSASTCRGFEVYSPEYFYPIAWRHARAYFDPGPTDLNSAYVYHVYNHVTHRYRVARGSPYEALAKRFCPTTYVVLNDDFRSTSCRKLTSAYAFTFISINIIMLINNA